MKKSLRYIVAGVLLALCTTGNAQTVFDFDANGQQLFGLPGESDNDVQDGDFTEAKTATIDNFSITVSTAEEGKTANRIWYKAPKLRVYSGTITITSSDANIKSIEVKNGKWNDGNSVSTGTYDTSAKKWTGDAKEVVFTIAGNTQINSITISTDGGGETPDPGQVVEGTCQDVINGQDGVIYQVKGKCVTILNTTYGNWDLQDETGTIRIYGTLDAEGKTKNFSSLGIEEGDIVTVKGPRKDYNGTIELVDVTVVNIEKPSQTTAAKPVITPNGGNFETEVEVTLSHSSPDAELYYALNDGDFQHYGGPFTLTETTTVKAYAVDEECDVKQSETVEATFTKVTIEKVSVAQALAIIDGLADGAKTNKEYDVEGYIVYIKEVSPKVDGQGYGNATYDINDEAGATENALTVYRGYYLNKEFFTAEDQIAVGEKVVVRGLLQRYVKNEVMTPELAQGNYIMSKGDSSAITQLNADAESGVVYNLQGQRVVAPTKGLYIINGKKVMK